ncbi:MAG: hypothetical protein NC095_06065 [Muribaculum sp.]|nr:hypothetical protein [Muribaculum sp.]
MKKLYILSLGLIACSMTMSAASFSQTENRIASKSNSISNVIATEKSNSSVMHRAPKAAAETNPSIDDIVGEYTWNFYSYLNSSSGSKLGTMELSKDEDNGGLLIDLLGWPVKGSFDAEKGIISIEANQFIEYNEYNKMDVFFYHNRWNDDGQGNYFLDTPLEITVEGDYLYCDDFDNIAIGNSSVGWFIFAGSNTFSKKQAPIDMETGWTQIGTGTFYDGWVLTGMGMTVADMEAQGFGVDNVILEQNEAGLYRLNNPYQVAGSVFMEYDINVSETPGYIVFDASDHEFVTVMPNIYSGISDLDIENNVTDYYNFNLESYYTIVAGYSKDLVVQNLDEISNLDTETGTVMFYNCCFGIQGEEDSPYTWNSGIMTGMFVSDALKGTGVSINEVEKTNEPKEYFNLQGQRVANPDNGLYIVREGGKAHKVLIK